MRHPSADRPRKALSLVSFLLALMMWFSFSGRFRDTGSETASKFFQVPLRYQYIPDSMRLDAENYQIGLSLSGNQEEIAAISPEEVEVELSLKSYQAGPYNLPLDRENVKIPSAYTTIQVDTITPSLVRLILVQLTTKTLKIRMGTVGNPPPNYELTELRLDPEEVTVVGPSDDVDDLGFLLAQPLDLTGLTGKQSGRVRFDLKRQVPRDTVIKGLNSLHYTAVISEKKREIRLGAMKIQPPVVDRIEYKAEPETALPTLVGPISVIDWLRGDWFQPEITFVEGPDQDNLYPVTTRWVLPEDVKDQVPDWEDRISKITVTWVPPRVEVKVNNVDVDE